MTIKTNGFSPEKIKHMRILAISVLLLFFGSSVQHILAQTAGYEKLLANEWQVADVKYDEQSMQKFDLDAINEQVAMMKAKSSFNFYPDGTYEMNFLKQSSTGTWKISEDGKTIFSEVSIGQKEEINVIELKKDKLVIEVKDDDAAMIWTLVPVKNK